MKSFVVAETAPLLDRAGVEAARVLHAARASLVSSHPAVTFSMLAEARGQTEPAARQSVTRLRSSGRMVTIDFQGTTLIPSFQFDEAYEPVEGLGLVVACLTEAGMSGWAVWRWFCVVNPWIERRPVELVRERHFEELGRLADKLIDSDSPVRRG